MEYTHTLKPKNLYPLILCLSAALFFLPFLGATHLFDWDEINFAESAREMIVTGDYSRVRIDYEPFWEKPPLFFWMQAASMHLFGINEFAARFPNALMGMLTALTLYYLGRRLKNERFGFIWGLAYLSTIIPFVYFKSGVIDPTFNYFIFLSICFWARSHEIIVLNKTLDHQPPGRKNPLLFSMLAGMMAGIATLAKGPVALLLIGLTTVVFWIIGGTTRAISVKNILVFGVFYTLVSSLWFGLEVINNGPSFIIEFLQYQLELFRTPVAGHSQPLYYHFVVVFFGCFPVSILALPVLFRLQPKEEDFFLLWMKILFWVVMILFTIVKTKIVHYSSQAYFPLSFMGALYIWRLVEGGTISRGILRTLMVVGVILASLLTLLPILILFKNEIVPYIRDPFAVANLSVGVKWTGVESLIGAGWLGALFMVKRQILKGQMWRGFLLLFYSTMVCLFLYLKIVVPKIEQYSQGTAIKFYEELAGKDVYIKTLGFRSYGPFFYARKRPGERPEAKDEDWLMSGPIDKPAYFVVKITARDYLEGKADIRLMKEEGGFLFYERLPAANSSD